METSESHNIAAHSETVLTFDQVNKAAVQLSLLAR